MSVGSSEISVNVIVKLKQHVGCWNYLAFLSAWGDLFIFSVLGGREIFEYLTGKKQLKT